MIEDPEFKSFEELVWQAHLAAREDVHSQQATLNGILQAVLVTENAAVGTNTKLAGVTSKLGAVADTTAKSAMDIAECQ